MIDLSSFIKSENIPSLVISSLAFVVACFSARYTYKNYKINEGIEWTLTKNDDNTWKLERNHRKRVVIIGLAALPSFRGYEVSTVGPVPRYYTKGTHVIFRLHSSSSSISKIENIRIFVFSKPYFFKKLNHSFNEELTKKILYYEEPKDGLFQAIKKELARNNPPATLWEKASSFKKKLFFKIKFLRITEWASSLP